MLQLKSDILKILIPSKVFSVCVLTVITVNMIFIGGKRRNFGLFVSSFYQTFNGTSMLELNMVGDSYSSLAFILMPFMASAICHWDSAYQLAMFFASIFILTSSLLTSVVTSPGQLFLTHTLLHGIGSGLVLSTTALVVADYFDKNHRFHVLATSLASTGAYGVLILTPVFAHFIQNYGWRIAFQIIGAMFFVEVTFGVMFFVPKAKEYDPLEVEKKKEKFKWKFVTLAHVKENKQIILWFFDRALNGAIFFALLMNLTEYRRQSSDVTIEIETSSMINVMLGVGECFVFTITMLIGDHMRGKLCMIQLLGACFSFLSVIMMRAVSDSNWGTNFITVILGGSVGMGNCVLYASSAEAMNIDGSISLPMSKMVSAIGTLLSPLFSGLIIDNYGYEGLFVSLTLLTFLRIVGLTIINYVLYKRQKEMMENQNNPQKPDEYKLLNYTEEEKVTPISGEIMMDQKRNENILVDINEEELLP